MNMFPRIPSIVALAALACAATSVARAQSPSAKAPANPPVAGTLKAVDLPGFALIPAGEFTMGDALDGDSYAPQHKVNVSAFYMQKKEVTNAQWDEVRAWGLKNGYTDLPEGSMDGTTSYNKGANHPVNSVQWWAVVKWCNAKSVKEGLIPAYYTDAAQTVVYQTGKLDLDNTMVKLSANGYRLPTEAEWEKAARGGLSGKRFPWGDTISHDQANFKNSNIEIYQNGTTGYHPTYMTGEEPYTSPVGSFAANGYGLYDMTGNVQEWCWDNNGNDGAYPSVMETDPRGATGGSLRAVRGGCPPAGANYCRVANRVFSDPSTSGNYFGFRIARSSASK
jgi:formylglycine-generating enzyme required for sulfatase activity